MKNYSRVMPILVSSILVFCVALPLQAADRVSGETFATRSPVLATQAMAATSQPLATQVALDVMKKAAMPLMPQ